MGVPFDAVLELWVAFEGPSTRKYFFFNTHPQALGKMRWGVGVEGRTTGNRSKDIDVRERPPPNNFHAFSRDFHPPGAE